MKAEEKQKLMQECLQYFRERPVYEKVFQKMRGKYESLGHIGGKVVLTGLSLQDKSQLGGFLQKDYTRISLLPYQRKLLKSVCPKAGFLIFLWRNCWMLILGKS